MTSVFPIDWHGHFFGVVERLSLLVTRFASQHDFLISVCIGGAISIALVYVGSGPAVTHSKRKGKKCKKGRKVGGYGSGSETEDVPTHVVSAGSINSGSGAAVRVPFLNKEKVVEKSKPFQELFNITSEQVGEAVDMTNMEIAEEADKGNFSIEEGVTGVVSAMDFVVYLCFFLFCFYCLNYWSNGDFGRMINGMFPVEMRSLRLYNLLHEYHSHSHPAVHLSEIG